MITDTTTKAEKLHNQIFMRLSGAQKVRLAMAFSDTVRDIAWAGFRRRHPSVSEETLRTLFLDEVHGIEWRKGKRSESQSDE